MWLNEYDIDDATILFALPETPNLRTAADALARLVDWTNRNSDGWPYWQKPARAAKRLMELINANTYAARFGYYQGTGNPLVDVTEADVKRALTPVKAFLTKQGADWRTVLA